MSGRRIGWLVGLLVVQLLLFVALLAGRGGFREPDNEPLLVFATDSVDGLEITEGSAEPLRLALTDGRWTLPSGAPADSAKIEDVLNKLADLRAPWPVATSAAARARFEVADDNRQRHVRLLAGERAVAELYLGTSPGFRRLHARVPGQDAVYEVDLTHFQLSAAADEWLDRGLLQAAGEVTAIAREGAWRLARSDAGWMLDDGAADTGAAEQMASRFTNLRVLGLVPDDAAPAETRATFLVTDANGTHRLTLGVGATENEYELTSDRFPGRFRLAAFLAEQLLVEADALLPNAEPADAALDAGADRAADLAE
ncbi:MAG: DUF4340 domain-containing protein [Pseudomonadales bacterium]|nr:DUF4340 domain-containing protein [Pseudomonadales bacterium]